MRFQPIPTRLARNVCMRRCTEDGNCRVGQGYHCVGAADVDFVAIVDVGRPLGRFCVAPQ